jgi:hypothetical protein
MEVGGRVLARGTVTTTDVTAGPADTQLHRLLAKFQALLAGFGLRLRDSAFG